MDSVDLSLLKTIAYRKRGIEKIQSGLLGLIRLAHKGEDCYSFTAQSMLVSAESLKVT